jgi:predicted metal-dependent phosphoesterase TrpH
MTIGGGADLHVHTTRSDGALAPCEVVRAAASAGLDAVAITDHDTMAGIAPARAEAGRVGVRLIAGVELSCEHAGRGIHLLGYLVDPEDPDLLAACAGLRRARRERFARMADRLRAEGFRIDRRALDRIGERAVLGRPHLADYLARTGQVRGRDEAFERFLTPGAPAYEASPALDAGRAIGLIRGAGGVAALAHPPVRATSAWVETLVRIGLGAIEVDGPGIARERSGRLRVWAGRFGLVPVAGSDFHAPDRPGRYVGAIRTPRADLDALDAAARGGSAVMCEHVSASLDEAKRWP